MNPKPRRALIVIDVQNEYVTGNLRIEYPDVSVSLANIGRAMDAANAAGIPVAVVQNSAPEGSPIFARASDGWQLHEVVASRPCDHRFEKRLPSAFSGTSLEAWIADNAIDTLVVAGYMTHNCDDATIKHALHLGIAVEFLSDASGSIPYANRAGTASAEQIHKAVSVVLQSRFAAVMSTDEWIDAVNTDAMPLRESIYASYMQARRG